MKCIHRLAHDRHRCLIQSEGGTVVLSDSDKICRGLRCARIATAPEMQNGEISIEVNDRGYYSYHNLARVKHR